MTFQIDKSGKLDNVCYDIRGPVLKEAKRLEEEGNKVLKLNIGNPAPFGFEAPDEILVDVIRNLPSAQGYCDSKGLYSARKAIMQHYQARDMRDVTVEDIYIGNGVSELIVQAMQALLNSGDEMLVPAPDYPLWTAAVSLSSGKAVHYLCDESADWFPDLDDIRSKITPRTRGIVIINPNNPTGAVYSKELLLEIVDIARQHNLIIFADEIYDKILYDEAQHHCIAALAPDLLTVTFNGLSKTYRVAGFRQGWMVLNGPKKHAKGYIEGLEMLASMRIAVRITTQQILRIRQNRQPFRCAHHPQFRTHHLYRACRHTQSCFNRSTYRSQRRRDIRNTPWDARFVEVIDRHIAIRAWLIQQYQWNGFTTLEDVIRRAIPQGWRGAQHLIGEIARAGGGDHKVHFALIEHFHHERVTFYPYINRQFRINRGYAV